MTDLTRLTVAELRSLAAERGVAGRSSMRKAALVAALTDGATKEDRLEARTTRWLGFIDTNRRCAAPLPTGAVCDLPSMADHARCGLHGGMNIADVSKPILGELGPSTWPDLRRHQAMASYDPDELGADPVATEVGWWLLNFLYDQWFDVTVEGIEHIPAEGAGILVPNHAGAALPYDAAMLSLAVVNEAPIPRRVRIIGTEIFNMLPFVSHLYRRGGGAFAAHGEADWALENGLLLGVFPEGVAGFQKGSTGTYQTTRFGRGGFAQLAARHGAPIIPVAIIGSEETHPVVFTSRKLARLVRLVFPEQRVEEMAVWLNPIPLPVKWTIRFLPPVQVAADADRLRILEVAEATRQTVQTALDGMLAARST